MSYFEKGGVADKIDIKIGNALEIIEETTGFLTLSTTISTKMNTQRLSKKLHLD
jgi:hypothetical protein